MYSYGEVTYGEYQVWLLLLTMAIGRRYDNIVYQEDYTYPTNYTFFYNPWHEISEICFKGKTKKYTNCREVNVPAISVMRITNKHIGVSAEYLLTLSNET